jgi:poly-gamma-glutamate synthesis protein (capsule biosynthesis protein)
MKKLLLAILAGLAALLVALTLVFVLNTNNDDTPRNYVPHATTEPATEPPAEPVNIRIQFAGDALMHSGPIGAARTGQNTAGYNTYDFRPFLRDIAPFIRAGDLNIINMETPVDAYGNNTRIYGFPLFNVPREILPALSYAGFNHLVFANNHTMDRQWQGMLNTLDNFREAGFSWTGAYATRECSFIPTIIDVEGIRVGVLAYTDSLNGLDNWVPADMRPYAVPRFRSHVTDDIPLLLGDINRIRDYGAEVVVVSFHWGREYVDAPTNTQRQIAAALVDGGADIIMGHHSHSPQPVRWHEREDGTRGLIMYSLGNFLSDQTRLIVPEPRTQYGMLVSVNIVKELDGGIRLDSAEVLPTVCVRDFTGDTLGHEDAVTILPLINGEVPDEITDEYFRAWGRRAYAHTTRIVDAAFITASHEKWGGGTPP